ncbi:hypothetical protein E0Z10_g1609 [Xylaria hypoxylon]|uniref:Uncharacterized protein n=1 Tax=Xylaria hypoxylon TaxID=37992 RepID=A0A4Z0Z6A5_9PEZI|nr:hypothetical protein E0Z10_g1609 [Xylaria hypoxylon]
MPGVLLDPIAGCIKWLPRKQDLMPTDSSIEEGCCHHPVVILSTQPRNDRVEFLTITSFGGLDLETKYPTQLQARQNHLPIAPSKTHPDNGIRLVLRDTSQKLRKKSYVKTKQKRSIFLASLQPYNRQGPEVFLSKRSYQALIKYIQFTEPPHELVLDSLAVGRTPSFLRDIDLERSLDERQRAAAEDVVSLLNYHARSTEGNRAQQPRSSYQAPRHNIATHTPSTYATRAERQPLLPPHEEYRPRHYGSHTILPTTHPIRPDYGSGSSKPFDWAKFRKCVKIVLWICMTLFISYGVYRGGCWVVTACSHALGWMKEALGLVEKKPESPLASFLQKLGLQTAAYKIDSMWMSLSQRER